MIDIEIRDVEFAFETHIYLVDRDISGRIRRVAKPITVEWVDYTEGSRIPSPTITVAPYDMADIAQNILKKLKKYDRTVVKDESAEITSIKHHLEDMRRLVFESTPQTIRLEPIIIPEKGFNIDSDPSN